MPACSHGRYSSAWQPLAGTTVRGGAVADVSCAQAGGSADMLRVGAAGLELAGELAIE